LIDRSCSSPPRSPPSKRVRESASQGARLPSRSKSPPGTPASAAAPANPPVLPPLSPSPPPPLLEAPLRKAAHRVLGGFWAEDIHAGRLRDDRGECAAGGGRSIDRVVMVRGDEKKDSLWQHSDVYFYFLATSLKNGGKASIVGAPRKKFPARTLVRVGGAYESQRGE